MPSTCSPTPSSTTVGRRRVAGPRRVSEIAPDARLCSWNLPSSSLTASPMPHDCCACRALDPRAGDRLAAVARDDLALDRAAGHEREVRGHRLALHLDRLARLRVVVVRDVRRDSRRRAPHLIRAVGGGQSSTKSAWPDSEKSCSFFTVTRAPRDRSAADVGHRAVHQRAAGLEREVQPAALLRPRRRRASAGSAATGRARSPRRCTSRARRAASTCRRRFADVDERGRLRRQDSAPSSARAIATVAPATGRTAGLARDLARQRRGCLRRACARAARSRCSAAAAAGRWLVPPRWPRSHQAISTTTTTATTTAMTRFTRRSLRGSAGRAKPAKRTKI